MHKISNRKIKKSSYVFSVSPMSLKANEGKDIADILLSRIDPKKFTFVKSEYLPGSKMMKGIAFYA